MDTDSDNLRLASFAGGGGGGGGVDLLVPVWVVKFGRSLRDFTGC